ncbi:MAG TPA: lipase family protein [Candidatus Acidoferrales bacterium]|nr:lipase family protein [Candidatus Acidoferrales bacterium]
MSIFDPAFARNTLLPIAQAAYLADQGALALPANYAVVGQIAADPAKLNALAAGATTARAALAQRIQASGTAFGWVVQNAAEQIVVVAFRGTSDLNDWLHDFDFVPEPYQPVAGYGMVHQGFQSVYLAVAESASRLLQSVAGACKRLIVTGHSLGAALSELAAPALWRNCTPALLPEVQNFAGPRVGHSDFAGRFDQDIDACFRVVNVWDIVPQVPPALAQFEHVGLAVDVDGGFTLDELTAHNMAKSYGPGLDKLIPPAGARPMALVAAPAAALAFPNAMLIGRQP